MQGPLMVDATSGYTDQHAQRSQVPYNRGAVMAEPPRVPVGQNSNQQMSQAGEMRLLQEQEDQQLQAVMRQSKMEDAELRRLAQLDEEEQIRKAIEQSLLDNYAAPDFELIPVTVEP